MAFRTTAAKLMLNKIGIVGGGNIGGVLAQECAKRNLAKTVALMDIAVSLLRPARDNSLPPRRGSPPRYLKKRRATGARPGKGEHA